MQVFLVPLALHYPSLFLPSGCRPRVLLSVWVIVGSPGVDPVPVPNAWRRGGYARWTATAQQLL